MKKLAVLFALLLAAMALVACGSDSSTDGDTSPVAGAVEDAEEKAEEAGEEVEEKAGEAKEEAEEAKEDAEDGSAGASNLDFEADPGGQLAYTEDEATAKAGNVTVSFTNPAPVPHDVRIESSDGKDVGGTEVISESSESAKVDLKPGDYTFYCSVPGHRQAGMEGDLTVG